MDLDETYKALKEIQENVKYWNEKLYCDWRDIHYKFTPKQEKGLKQMVALIDFKYSIDMAVSKYENVLKLLKEGYE